MVIVYKLLISPSWCTGVTSGMHKDLSLNRRSRSLSINMSLNAEGLSGLSSAQNEFSHSDNPGCLRYIGVPQYRSSASHTVPGWRWCRFCLFQILHLFILIVILVRQLRKCDGGFWPTHKSTMSFSSQKCQCFIVHVCVCCVVCCVCVVVQCVCVGGGWGE